MNADPFSSRWRCDYCGKPGMIVEPGMEEIRELFLLKRDEPVRCWCLSCWVQRFGKAAA